ncbi:MAG TPA: Gx transporter family protein [Candidatus Acetatifactor stercoripullorum]|uniref:Gx transporter family protein n=1 Tax=Candidatus Acetatifactor stercoripullorum TaxID=2838414 RepID=A0A9D1R6Q9_9FIRM|nr:Gx transporter family protein [Candidatus Acetatifactor stercoripullorum]HIW81890.1 Gx transporter family protein [Candidatus Acetatifactor stercoripullorum]
MKVKKLTLLALFTTLALIIFAAESMLPPLVPVPGIKLGLANIITLVVLRNFTVKDAAVVLFMRIFLSSFFFGQALSLLYSLAGGFLCLVVMCLINRLFSGHYLFLTSIAGALAHNAGQLLTAFFITQTAGIFIYLPFLMLGGLVTGLFTGLCAHFSQKYLVPLINR